jgi:hydrogenase-4 component F
MLLLFLVIVPTIAGLVALAVESVRIDLGILLGVCAAHLALTIAWWFFPAAPLGLLIALDLPGHLFLTLTSVLFFVVALYAVPYVLHATHDAQAAPHLFVPCLLWFLASMTLVTVTQHLAVMWAAIEATTLASAPLIYFYHRKSALEATWKYLLICSVGIALALLGTFFLGIAAAGHADSAPPLVLGELQKAAPTMTRRWLEVAFVMALIGYGTKMGLAPLHTWLPDAHSQAPSPVSALLSGTLLNCAFLGILRFYQVALASTDAVFASTLLVLFGFVSIGLAASFMVGQRDYKRLFAYSSVENMGVLALGVGLGGTATFGAMLHAVNHSLCKAALFLLAGNVLRAYGTTTAGEVRGVFRRLPLSGVLLAAGFFAIGGAPPFGPFMSELVIFQSAVRGAGIAYGALFIALLAIAFLGMAGVLLPMLQGDNPQSEAEPAATREPTLSVVAPLVLCVAVLVLGIYVPEGLSDVLHRTAALLGGAHG